MNDSGRGRPRLCNSSISVLPITTWTVGPSIRSVECDESRRTPHVGRTVSAPVSGQKSNPCTQPITACGGLVTPGAGRSTLARRSLTGPHSEESGHVCKPARASAG